MNKLSFDEIRSGEEFEDLVAQYFRVIKGSEGNSIKDVRVEPSGKGSDGGRDILLVFELYDSIMKFQRKWVVQCKFLSKLSTGKSDIGDVNIPTLIHEYGAEGYLLIVRNEVTNELQNSFDRLNQSCKLGYTYEIWRGSQFLSLLGVAPKSLIEQYFPNYYFQPK